jgi:hypothetical protein
MATCPNINLESWKNLVASRGEDVAYYLWDKYAGNVPESESKSEVVKAGLKSVNALQSERAIQLFSSLEKNKVKGDAFWNKIQTDLQIPKEQVDLLKSFNTTDRNELITNMLANYSYAIEINIPKEEILKGGTLTTNTLNETSIKKINDVETSYNVSDSSDNVGKYYIEYFDNNNQPSFNIYETYNDAINDIETKGRRNNSQYYSNLTVPGGTNYTENEIATPAIKPGIKGHAQFATDNGIGWFRSDDKLDNASVEMGREIEDEYDEMGRNLGRPPLTQSFKQEGGTETKTRRILEVQSDLFQKSRDKEDLIQKESIDKLPGGLEGGFEHNGIKYTHNAKTNSWYAFEGKTGKSLTRLQYIQAYDNYIKNTSKVQSKENQFLQLLNKDNNWVTFFVKSIVQDSAKKGYEKVLFPSGDTASKVEGHTTLEEFKKQKEDRIKQLEEEKKLLKPIENIVSSREMFYNRIKVFNLKKANGYLKDGFAIYTDKVSEMMDKSLVTNDVTSNPSGVKFTYINLNEKDKDEFIVSVKEQEKRIDSEINQLKQELERVEKEGFAALKPIYNFYENTVANVLKKQGYSPKQVTDEYDNTWNEIEIVPQREQQSILLQTEEMPASKASPETIAKVKQVLEKMGVSIKELQEYAKEAKLDIPGGVNGLADISQRIVAIAEGREDVALTEEMVHIATAILEQKNPGLVTEMISKIDRFTIYKRTLKAYENNPKYQLANGKPDIRKIKKEAVDKLIAELIVYGNEGNTEFPELLQEENQSLIKKWWQKILDWFAGAYKKADIDIFEQTARQIMQGELSSEDVDLSGYDEYYQVSDAQKPIQEMIISKSKDIRKVVEKGPVDPLFMDTEEASNYYEGKQTDGTWKRVTKRVTDRVKAWYKRKFPSKEFSETEKKFNEFKRKLGVKFHSYFEDIYGRFYNPETGEKRTTSLKRNVKFDNRREEQVYNDLESYFISLINKVSEDSKVAPLVFSEVILYDEKVGEAGTIDLLIVDENGKANIIDWKFMTVYKEAKDIAWYKQGAYNIQLGRYKDMLRERYGVKEFGMIRAIPFLLNIDTSKYELQGMTMGSVNVNEIKNLTLLPISEETESTEIKEMDEIVRKLNIVLKESEKDKTSTTIEYEQKRDRNNAIRTAIRWLQTGRNLQPLLEVINVMRREGDLILNDYAEKYKGKPANSKGVDFEQKALSDFSSELRNYGAFAKVFGNITDYIGKYIYNEDMEKDAKTKEDKEALKLLKDSLDKIKSEQDAIRISAIEVGKIAGEFADKFIGQRNLVRGLLSPEPIIKGLSSLFRGVADLGVASFDVLEKMVTNAKDRGARDASAEVDRLMEIRKKIVAKGGDVRKYVQRIYQKDDKNKLVNKLVYKYKKDFYEKVDANAQDGKRSRKWLTENIDVESYKKEVDEILKSKIERIRAIYEDEEDIDEKILEERKKYDITRSDFTGFSNPIIKKHPLTKWQSEEYLQIKKDPELFELYNFIMEMNEKAKEMGYLPNQASTSFLPFIRKSMAESFAWDFDLSVITNMGKNLSIQAETVGYGKLNELTNELENSIPKYYTYDFTRLEDGTNDYSDVSEDVFKNMILYINHMEKYKYLSEIEDQLLLVKSIEAFKGHVQTNNLGDISTDANGNIIFLGEGEKDSEGNSKLYNDFLRALLYEQKYPLSDSDTPLPINVRNFMKKAINKVAGKEVYEEDENPSATSLMKTVDAVNTGFQLKTLGLEFISGAVNAFGSNIQIAAQSGNYFKSREVLANEMKLIGNKWKNKEEYETFSSLIELFLPLREDPNYEKIKKAGLSPFTRGSTSDTLMMFMKYPEQHLEKSIFKTLLENTMVENGKLVNINEFVKKKYQGRSASAAAYRAASVNIKKEVKQLKEERSLYVIAKMENDKLVIPGFDTSNIEEIQKLSRLTKRVSRNALGGMSQSDINRMGLNIWTKSMMVFKNWIPKLIDTRFGEFRKVSDDFSVEIGDDGLTTGEKYEIGRIRLFAGFLHINILKTVKELNDVLSVNDAGLLKINELYEKYAADYKKRNGKDLNMSLDDFTDLIKTNLRNQVKELLMLASMVAMAMTLGFFKPDDDEDKATKNFYRFSQRVVNKFIQELSFFYNPIEFEKLLSGSIFPAIGLFSDFGRFTDHFFMQITGNEAPYIPGFSESDLTPEQVRKKAQPVKNLGKMFPGTKSLFTYGAILDAEFAKEYDITIQKETGFR